MTSAPIGVWKLTPHRDLDHSVLVSFSEICFCFDYVQCALSYVGSRDLVRQWPAVHTIKINKDF